MPSGTCGNSTRWNRRASPPTRSAPRRTGNRRSVLHSSRHSLRLPSPLRERVAPKARGEGSLRFSKQGPLTRLASLATLSLKARGSTEYAERSERLRGQRHHGVGAGGDALQVRGGLG